MKNALFTFNKNNPDMSLYVCLQEAAIGFLSNCAILYDKFKQDSKGTSIENIRLQTPYSSNLLQSVELFLKIILLSEGHRLEKLKTHKIYNLYKKLKPETQKYLKSRIDGSRKYWDSLEGVLKQNNDKFIRLRYNDLTESAILTFKGGEVLIGLALFLCESTGFKIIVNGKNWEPT